MKIFVIIAVIAVIVAVEAGQTEDQKAEVDQYTKECINESSANPVHIKKLAIGVVIKNIETEKFVKCLLEKIAFWKDGKFQRDVAIEKLSVNISQARVERVVDECILHDGNDEKEIAFNIYTCIIEKQGHLL